MDVPDEIPVDFTVGALEAAKVDRALISAWHGPEGARISNDEVAAVVRARLKLVDIARSREWSRGKRQVRLVEVDDGHELVASLPRITAETDEFLRPFLGGPRE